MKINRLLSAFLALVLSTQMLMVPASAETESTQPPSESELQTLPPQTMPVLPPVTPPEIPLTGDASINYGSHTIRAQVPAAGPTAPQVQAKAAFLYDLNSDTVLYSYNADDERYPASLTKVMTCLVALEHLTDLHEVLTVPQELVDRVDPLGSVMSLKGGEEIAMIDLLYGLMVHSANDAAMLIAQHVAGSEEGFVEMMNAKAAELECEHTHFANVHGLHNENHYTTARDMARILRAAVQNETFRELYSTDAYEVPATNLSEERLLVSTNYLISKAVMKSYFDPRVVGGKTGFTTPAGRCLVTVSRDNESGLELLCVIMGAGVKVTEDGSEVVAYGHFEETEKLINYGFANFRPAEVLSDAQTLGRFEVEGGDAVAQAKVRGSCSTVLPTGSTINDIYYEYLIDDGVLTAPLEIDQPIGMVRVWHQNRCLAQQELYSASHIKKAVEIAEIPEVDPSRPLDVGTNPWHTVLVAILILLAAIFVILVYGNIRRAVRRAKRRKRRAPPRRTNPRGGDPRRAPGNRNDQKRRR